MCKALIRTVILDASTLGEDIDLSVFDEFGETIVRQATSSDKVTEVLAGAEIAVVNKVRLDRRNLSLCPDLKLICVAATGYDNIDVSYCREKGITVCNVPGYSTESVAQLTLAMVLSLTTHLTEYTSYVKSGAYSASGVANRLTPVYHDLSQMTWGIVGYGNIGKKVAHVAEAIGCRVLVCRSHPAGTENERDIDTICRKCDVISLHTPLNESTRGLIGERRLSLMKKNAVLVNLSRGAVVDEAAVAKAVSEGTIAAFGSDVYTAEPLPESHPFYPIRNQDNVCLTPHMAWGSYESRVRCVSVILENIRSYLSGKPQNSV